MRCHSLEQAIEALGKADTWVQTLHAVRHGGRAVMVGIAPLGATAPVEINRVV